MAMSRVSESDAEFLPAKPQVPHHSEEVAGLIRALAEAVNKGEEAAIAAMRAKAEKAEKPKGKGFWGGLKDAFGGGKKEAAPPPKGKDQFWETASFKAAAAEGKEKSGLTGVRV